MAITYKTQFLHNAVEGRKYDSRIRFPFIFSSKIYRHFHPDLRLWHCDVK
jgi:hypothetical protein